jgi:hypothetical protein
MRWWFINVVLALFPNCHIAWSYRGEEDQAVAVRNGASHVQWPGSKHNKLIPKDPALPADLADETDPNTVQCSEALDLFIIDKDGVAWWPKATYLALAMNAKTSGHLIKWGGTFQRDYDGPHFEYDYDAVAASGAS